MPHSSNLINNSEYELIEGEETVLLSILLSILLSKREGRRFHPVSRLLITNRHFSAVIEPKIIVIVA